MQETAQDFEWPDADTAWKPVTKGPKKAEKGAAPDCSLAVDAQGKVRVSFSPKLLDYLAWNTGKRVSVGTHDAGDTVFISIVGDQRDGNFTLQGPPTPTKDGGPSRCYLALGLCGGVDLATRRMQAVKHRTDCGVVTLAVSRVVDEITEEAGHEVAQAQPAPKQSPKLAKGGAGAAASKSAPPARTFDLVSLSVFALDAAVAAWPVKIERHAQPVKVAAAVALVECGFALDAVRRLFAIEHLLLPDREDMKPNGMAAATAAVAALREAMGDE